MKIIHISTYDTAGGAARAAYRLHQGLQHINIDSQMLVQAKFSDDRTVISPQTNLEKTLANIGYILDSIPLRFYKHRQKTEFSTQWAPEQILPRINQLNPDIINLHWINKSHLQIETIAKLNKPLVWTLHDMWAFTGGCHYTQNCNKYIDSCGACPLLGSNKNLDLSRNIWQRKHKAWKNINLTVVCLSKWMAKSASSSSLFKDKQIKIIPNGIDTQQYKPIDRHLIRELLNLPQDKKLILFGAINATSAPRKGFHFLQEALHSLCKSGWQDKIELVVMGASQPDNHTDFGFKANYLGKLSDDISLAQIYAAVDVFVAPSIQDNLPNTVMEAMSCGTPCVAFNIGGMPDMIEHEKNGYLAQPFEVEDLAQGIAWVLENKERHQKMCDRAREKVKQEFTLEIQASRYLSLFKEILFR
ncbi:glycosyltransferase family 4 protein [Calothrix sp. UHCC 0171]|uniref:glycosyltransferase family 4 protein n=1 Tax=Calothrix sp. UHCC 0171 TaxID=3110245 RepID=UPI002B1FF348|nr:glycosyltransferase family 4 protein [Calothrix sp. UHCC 0171]MEA5573951.1 glycosyltransferase family 4 protein [Calothrix sp. UHCC 0171]